MSERTGDGGPAGPPAQEIVVGATLPSAARGGSVYELVELLGQGGMGRVFRAVHHPFGAAVAVKVLRESFRGAGSRRLVLREAAAAARLRHPRIVELVDLTCTPDGTPALVMELVEGPSLACWLGAWPGWPTVARAFDDLLDGLAAAHGAGVVHRDLKPENVLLDACGRAKIADFGLAEVQDPLRASTEALLVAGTPAFMAPEQFDARGRIGPWTDLYAVGAMLYELLSGTAPFPGASVLEVLEAKRLGLAPERRLRPGLAVPPELLELAARLLVPEPRDRLRFAAEVRETLRALSAGVVDEAPRGEAARELRPPASFPGVDAGPTTVDAGSTMIDASPPTFGDEVGGPERRTAVSELAGTGHALRATPGLVRLRAVPLAARAAERTLLLELVDRVRREGRARALAIVGGAGEGKSALARWGLGEVERLGLMEGTAAGYGLEGAGATGGLRHAAGRLVGCPRPGERGWPRSWAWLRGDPREAPPFDAALLARWIRNDADEPVPVSRDAELAHEALRAASRVRPVYLWLDDAAWALDGAIDLVERLLARRDAAVAIVMTLRTGTAEHPRIRARLARVLASGATRVVELAPLGPEERRELLEAVVPFEDGLAAELARDLDDSPLLIVQRVLDWVDRGLVEAGGEGFRLAAGQSVGSLLAASSPGRLVAERVDALARTFGERAAEAESVLLRAAVLGVAFEERALHACCEGDTGLAALAEAVLDQALLQGLCRLEHDDKVYRFDHAVLQEHLLERLRTRPDRHEVLLQTAAGMAAVYERSRPDIGRRTAELLREAGDLERAVLALLAAAASMSHMGALSDAEEYVARATEWVEEAGLETDAPLRGALALGEADFLYSALRYEASLERLREAERIFELSSDEAMRWRARHLESGVLFFQDRFAEAEEVCRSLLEEIGPDEHELRFLCTHRFVQLAGMRGDLEEALRLAWASLEAARDAGIAWRVRMAEVTLAEAELALGLGEQGAARAAAIVAAAEPAGDVVMLDEALDLTMWADLLRGRLDRARARLSLRLPRAERDGDLWRLTACRAVAALLAASVESGAEAEAAAGRLAEAFGRAPHDEPFTRWAMRRAIEELDARGLSGPASALRAVLEARQRAIEAGFSAGAPGPRGSAAR